MEHVKAAVEQAEYGVNCFGLLLIAVIVFMLIIMFKLIFGDKGNRR